ncbi:DUF5590 domain-containing protein [Oceanobacillus halophilus]|uniref:Cell wall elongation regulator TseB-like domain-containing protein n=1 Tax=Oceanobacillus halophilus TaxID=930130 RepID=A0A495ACG6_9BACI|nr:DUF5590 domain-containing protein [Oceanobacillus halophilus]RKQ37638.1 hypothetical protein D8M06_02210 [Oceanobacillus halophilus]
MKNRQFSQSTGRKWLRTILIILSIAAIIGLALGIYLYQDIMEEKRAGFDDTKEIIMSQTSITKVEQIDRFHGDKAYHIVYGENDKKEKKIIFYPLEGTEKNITTVNTSDIIKKEQILSNWSKKCNTCNLIDITPALIEDDVLWELTYYDENDRYVLDYFSIYDGTSFERYRFKRMFN